MRAAIGLVASILALGCVPGGGGDGNGSNGDGGVQLPPGNGGGNVEEAARAIGSLYCDYIQQCPAADDDFVIFKLFIDAGGDCQSFFQRAFAGSLDDEFVAGARFDQAAMQRCRDAVLDNCLPPGDQPLIGVSRTAAPH